MISIKKLSIAFLICCCCCANGAHASSIAFSEEQLFIVKKQNMGKQWLMLLWSVDCPPCFKELAIIQKLQSQHDNLAVVVINTDADDDITKERIDIIKKFELGKLSHYHFIDGQSDQSRYIIDSNWYGELPRSYFFESNGEFHGKSGLVDEVILTHWLVL